MPRLSDKQKRWNSSELIEVFIYLNSNFNQWYENPYEACNKAMKATSVSRATNAIYSKVYKMIRAMEDYLETGKRQACDIMWKDQLIHDLVYRIHIKIKERKAREENEEAIKRKNLSDRILELDVKMKPENTNNQMTGAEATTSSANQINTEVPQLPFSLDTIDRIPNEHILKTECHARELAACLRKPIDFGYKEVRDLTEKITHRQNELKILIEEANDKVERLKNFNA
ncbi:hypothetical protein RclHR1_06680006 [Rhizophagus clarus]|uniref:Uncharacterized protein n=1 Tax=Rhizophagus clarus TaxID=94130 RepID=A0A2Z6S9K7_9GLOM|nr:hypothetical protein RclHR1_06680006 [Rhizophagus clarus]GES80004.1 hypothetical protein GLOIN_2v1789251 [Rhizophagus clarus]